MTNHSSGLMCLGRLASRRDPRGERAAIHIYRSKTTRSALISPRRSE